jgi:hypothetical protein
MLFHSEEHHDFNRGTHDHPNEDANLKKLTQSGAKLLTGPGGLKWIRAAESPSSLWVKFEPRNSIGQNSLSTCNI